jgi:anti-sigma factor ChrR (cupin superfamily)
MTGGRDVLDWLGLGGPGSLPGTRPDRAAAPEVEALATALFDLAPPVEPPAGLLAAIEAEIDAAPAGHRILRADEGGWTRWLDKIWRKDLASEAGAGPSIYLLRCEPGAVLPPHGHDRDEHVFVLEGAFVVDEVVVRAGDYQFAAADSAHAEHRSPEGCLVLVCA